MEPEFWIDSWQERGSKTSFHRPDIHPYVIKHTPADYLAGKRVFVPLAGKSNDLDWFRRHATYTTGVELVDSPIREFFDEHDLAYSVHDGRRYCVDKMAFLCADLFHLSRDEVGPVDLIYDRASLIAFPYDMRMRYLDKIDELSDPGTQILLITLEYEPRMETPPFSVTPDEVSEYYAERYAIEHIEWPDVPDHKMKYKFGLDFIREHAFMLTRR